MRKIRKVVIKNFQSHKDTEINLGDYVIIHGATNSGKSAIIRAIKWCLYNESPPEGAELTRFGEKDTEVSLYFNDGRVITRKRAGKLNEYILYDEGGVATNYTGFGRGPLKEVLDFHGMYQANLFGEPQSINIVDQQEPPFFLSEGPTARGHLISRLAETLTYEAALIMLKKDAGDLKRGIDEKRASIDNLSGEIEKLSYVDELDKFIQEAAKNSEIIERNDKFVHSAPSHQTCIHSDAVAYRRNFNTAAIMDDVTDAQETIQRIETGANSARALERSKELLNSVINQWRTYHNTYSKLHDVEDAASTVSEIDKNTSKLNQIGAATLRYKELVDSYISLQKNALLEREILGTETDLASLESNLSLLTQINAAGQKIRQLSMEYAKLHNNNENIWEMIRKKTEEYKSLLFESGTCPTCFGKVNSENLIGVEI